MSGLRERKKHQTRQRILAAAARSFVESGFGRATMEEIAASAEVSVGTLYNYFRSKTALQLALFEAETERMYRSGSSVVESPGDDPVAAVVALFDAYLSVVFELDRALLRDAIGAGFSQSALAEGLFGLDVRLMGQLGDLLGRLGAVGALNPRIDTEDAVLLLFGALVAEIAVYVTVESWRPDDVRRQMSRLAATAFMGLAAER